MTHQRPDIWAPGSPAGSGLIGHLVLKKAQTMGSDEHDPLALQPHLMVAGQPFDRVALAISTAQWAARAPGDADEDMDQPRHVEGGPLIRSPFSGVDETSEERQTLWCCTCGHNGCGSTSARVSPGRLSGVEGVWLSDFITRDNPNSTLHVPPVFLPRAAWPSGVRARSYLFMYRWPRHGSVAPMQGRAYMGPQRQGRRSDIQAPLPISATFPYELGDADWTASTPELAAQTERERIQRERSVAGALRAWERARTAGAQAARVAAGSLDDPWGKALDLAPKMQAVREMVKGWRQPTRPSAETLLAARRDLLAAPLRPFLVLVELSPEADAQERARHDEQVREERARRLEALDFELSLTHLNARERRLMRRLRRRLLAQRPRLIQTPGRRRRRPQPR